MTAYLQRLVARTTTTQAARPFAHSRSPIAGRDQRIGLPGFTATAAARVEHGPAPDVDPDAGTTSVGRTTSDTVAAVDLAERPVPVEASVGTSPAGFAGPVSPAGAPRVGVTLPSGLPGKSSANRAPGAVRPDSERAPAPPASPAGVPGEPAASRKARRPAPSPADAVNRSTATPAEGPAPARPHTQLTSTRAEATPRIPEGAPLRGPTSPSPRGGDPAADRLVAAAAFAGLERRPRVEIGSIEVEVVPPPQERTERAPTGPVTAESVSVIGPLAARRPSSLRFAMRVR